MKNSVIGMFHSVSCALWRRALEPQPIHSGARRRARAGQAAEPRLVSFGCSFGCTVSTLGESRRRVYLALCALVAFPVHEYGCEKCVASPRSVLARVDFL